MKKILLFVFLAVLTSSCTQKVEQPVAGKSLGEIYVSAKPGAKSVLVKLDGLWRIKSMSEWISVDVNGRNGKGAFTLYYGSNESDFSHSSPTRKGCVVIESLSTMVADSLYVLQQGIPDGEEHMDVFTDSYVEFRNATLSRMKVLYANLDGCEDPEISSFVNSSDAQVIGMIIPEGSRYSGELESLSYGNLVFVNKTEYPMSEIMTLDSPQSLAVEVDGINFQISDFGAELKEGENRYGQAVAMLRDGYCTSEFGNKWIIGGSLYYLSIMESNYPGTPSWYPTDPHDKQFDADLYVQSNNLVDCIWSASRRFNPTFTDGGKSWRADYIYASNSMWNAAVQVNVKDTGINHKSLEIVLKYEQDKD